MRFDRAWWIEHGGEWASAAGAGGPEYARQQEALIDVLRRLPFDSVLEVGCGNGRLTRHIFEAFHPHAYLATDAMPYMAALTRVECAGLPVDVGVADLDDGLRVTMTPDDELPAVPDPDLVLAVDVLMHRPPEQAAKDAALLASLATKYVVIAGWAEPEPGEAEGCYAHDYAALFAPHPCEVVPVPEIRQAIVVVRVPQQHAALYDAPEGTPFPRPDEEPQPPWRRII